MAGSRQLGTPEFLVFSLYEDHHKSATGLSDTDDEIEGIKAYLVAFMIPVMWEGGCHIRCQPVSHRLTSGQWGAVDAATIATATNVCVGFLVELLVQFLVLLCRRDGASGRTSRDSGSGIGVDSSCVIRNDTAAAGASRRPAAERPAFLAV